MTKRTLNEYESAVRPIIKVHLDQLMNLCRDRKEVLVARGMEPSKAVARCDEAFIGLAVIRHYLGL